MSYILDALKRADAERERGAVPGLYARQLTGPGTRSGAHAWRPLWLAAGAVVLLAVVAAAVLLWPQPPQAAPPVAAPTPIARPVATAPAIAAPVAQALQLPSVPTTVATVSLPVRPTPTAKPAASAAPPPVPLLAELPEDLRRQVPALTITGAVYSGDASQRLLLVNNLVLPQGSAAAPEVTLEEIGSRSSIFNFRGTRFRLPH